MSGHAQARRNQRLAAAFSSWMLLIVIASVSDGCGGWASPVSPWPSSPGRTSA